MQQAQYIHILRYCFAILYFITTYVIIYINSALIFNDLLYFFISNHIFYFSA